MVDRVGGRPIIGSVPIKILVVEDTANIRRIIAGTLRSRGYEVIESGDGLDASERIARGGLDLVVLDARLPRRTGIEVCSGLKGDPRTSGLPVLLLTASGEGEGLRDRAGADGFLAKPFKRADLVSRIEGLLGPGRRE
jgi:CheY-like chemotaxis protein